MKVSWVLLRHCEKVICLPELEIFLVFGGTSLQLCIQMPLYQNRFSTPLISDNPFWQIRKTVHMKVGSFSLGMTGHFLLIGCSVAHISGENHEKTAKRYFLIARTRFLCDSHLKRPQYGRHRKFLHVDSKTFYNWISLTPDRDSEWIIMRNIKISKCYKWYRQSFWDMRWTWEFENKNFEQVIDGI